MGGGGGGGGEGEVTGVSQKMSQFYNYFKSNVT